MSGGNIQGVNVQADKLVAIDQFAPDLRPTIEEFTTILLKLDRYNFPKKIKDLASELSKANKNLRIAETQLRLAQKQKEFGTISQVELEEVRNKFKICGERVAILFAEVKQEYMSWYDKNVPEKLKKAWFRPFSAIDSNIRDLHHWFKTYTYNVKYEIDEI